MNNSTQAVEKYRPQYFDDIVLDEMNRQIFENILNKKYFPHLLFTVHQEQEKQPML